MNKKHVISFFIIVITICILLFSGYGKQLHNLETCYEKNPTDENLFELCKVALVDEDNLKIIEYFPLLIKSPQFSKLIRNNLENGVTVTDCQNIYVDAYIYACYNELEYDDFKKRLIEIFPYFVYEKNSSSDYTIYLQAHFLNTITTNEVLTKNYIDVLCEIYENEELPLDLRIDGYQFVGYWYGQIGEIEDFKLIKVKQKILEDQLAKTRQNQSEEDQSGDGSMIES